MAGHAGRVDRARRGLADHGPEVQAAAVVALARVGALTVADVTWALGTGSTPLRRAAVESALEVRGPGSRSTLPALMVEALGDPDPLVVVGAAWFLAERRVSSAVAPSGHHGR